MTKNNSSPSNRRQFLASAAAGIAAMFVASRLSAQRNGHGIAISGSPQAAPAQEKLKFPAGVPREIVLYKDPNCGCCTEWVKHMSTAGFIVKANNTPDMPSVRTSMGVPSALQSCHTGRIGNYVVEGHVPADLVLRMLTEKPDARGLAVPGMPMGSPGMEGPRKDKYDVVLFDKAGKSRVYATR